jgi:hypothetical protein
MHVATCIWSTLHVYARLQFVFNTLELHTPQHDSPAVCYIAQHYSSATFISLHTHSVKEKIAVLFKNVIFFSGLKIATSKIPSLKLHKSGSVYMEIQVPVNRVEIVCRYRYL